MWRGGAERGERFPFLVQPNCYLLWKQAMTLSSLVFFKPYNKGGDQCLAAIMYQALYIHILIYSQKNSVRLLLYDSILPKRPWLGSERLNSQGLLRTHSQEVCRVYRRHTVW